MKKTQTIVDREQLSSDYIESKQDFNHVLSQVKLLPTANWKSPWFYGPIGIAVLSVTVSIVSFNPSNAIASISEESKEEFKLKTTTSQIEKQNNQIKKEVAEVTTKTILVEVKEIDNQIKVTEKSNNKTSDKEESVLAKVSEENSNTDQLENTISNTTTIVKDNKIPSNNKFPYIDGYFTGKIPVESLFDKKGILLNESVQVVSFDLNFFTGRSNVVNQIKGNKIPEEMRSMITNFNIGKTIFLTNIKAYDREGRMYTLPSMNLIPIVNE